MKACDPALVDQDDRVPINGAPNAERRLVRYGWLRGERPGLRQGVQSGFSGRTETFHIGGEIIRVA